MVFLSLNENWQYECGLIKGNLYDLIFTWATYRQFAQVLFGFSLNLVGWCLPRDSRHDIRTSNHQPQSIPPPPLSSHQCLSAGILRLSQGLLIPNLHDVLHVPTVPHTWILSERLASPCRLSWQVCFSPHSNVPLAAGQRLAGCSAGDRCPKPEHSALLKAQEL